MIDTKPAKPFFYYRIRAMDIAKDYGFIINFYAPTIAESYQFSPYGLLLRNVKRAKLALSQGGSRGLACAFESAPIGRLE